MDETLKEKIFQLPRTDRIRLANDLWDSFFLDNTELTTAQLKFLQRRLAGYADEGCTFMSPDDIQKKLKKVSAALSEKRSAIRKARV